MTDSTEHLRLLETVVSALRNDVIDDKVDKQQTAARLWFIREGILSVATDLEAELATLNPEEVKI